MCLLQYVEHLALQKLCDAINSEPDSVRAHKLFQQFEAATQDATTYAYTTIVNTSNKTMMESQQTHSKSNARNSTKLSLARLMMQGRNYPKH